MRPSEHPPFRRGSFTAIALAFALPCNALAAEPTPDPPEPYVIGAPLPAGGAGTVTSFDHPFRL